MKGKTKIIVWAILLLVCIAGTAYSVVNLINERHADSYSLELNIGDGNWIVDAEVPTEFRYDSETVLPTAEDLYKIGYTFSSWNTENDGSGENVTKIEAKTKGDVVLYAQWTEDSYSIKYISNGQESESTYNFSTQETLQTPSRNGYTFQGWTEKIKLTDSDYFKGTFDAESGKFKKDTVDVYSKAIYLQAEIKYTLFPDGNYSLIVFKKDGTYLRTVNENTYTPTQDVYVHVVFANGLTTYVKANFCIIANNITKIEAGTTGNREYTANWAQN